MVEDEQEIMCGLSNGTDTNVFEWHWRSPLLFETFLTPTLREMWHVLATMCLHVHQRANVACNFNYLMETEGLFKVTGSHVQRKTGIISETVHDKDVVTTDH